MIATADLHWTAGFLDGEGWFGPGSGWKSQRSSLQVAATQKDPELLLKLKALFGGAIYYQQHETRRPFYIHTWRISGAQAVGLMMTLYPLLSEKRREKIRRCLVKWRQGGRKFSAHRVWGTPRTHCVRGHEATAANTYRGGNTLHCRVCMAENERRRRDRLKLLKAPAAGVS